LHSAVNIRQHIRPFQFSEEKDPVQRRRQPSRYDDATGDNI